MNGCRLSLLCISPHYENCLHIGLFSLIMRADCWTFNLKIHYIYPKTVWIWWKFFLFGGRHINKELFKIYSRSFPFHCQSVWNTCKLVFQLNVTLEDTKDEWFFEAVAPSSCWKCINQMWQVAILKVCFGAKIKTCEQYFLQSERSDRQVPFGSIMQFNFWCFWLSTKIYKEIWHFIPEVLTLKSGQLVLSEKVE